MKTEEITAAIDQAIQGLWTMELWYEAEHEARVVDPHIRGIDTAEHPAVRTWQTAGPHDPDDPLPNWRMFLVARIREVKLRQEHFVPQSCSKAELEYEMREVLCEVASG